MAFHLTIILVGGALIVMTGIAILNAFTFARLRAVVEAEHILPLPPSKVSICIPARNEARVIRDTAQALLAQSYPHLEILILDDHSTDGTGDLARAAANGDARLRVIGGAELPDGWHGKNWACQQLGEAATGDWLVFTDADVRWRTDAVSALIAQAERTQADLLTVWPTQTTVTWSERLVVPLMALVVLGYLPALAVHHAPFASLAAANGQCLCFRASAYRTLGGHRIVRNRIIEDIAFARAIKRARLRLRTADGCGLIDCRMYTNWQEVRDGYAKNIIAGYGSVIGLLLGTVFHWAVFLLPWVWLVIPSPLSPLPQGEGNITTRVGIAGLCMLGIGVRALTAAVTRQRIGDALLMPVSALLMTIIAGQALWWRLRYGGVRWKGRTLTPDS
ncbi:MAG: glycosyltransferase [Chloroflexota bacterium]|nr:glycosyltransferase [Chloroflexota bacterium]